MSVSRWRRVDYVGFTETGRVSIQLEWLVRVEGNERLALIQKNISVHGALALSIDGEQVQGDGPAQYEKECTSRLKVTPTKLSRCPWVRRAQSQGTCLV